MFPSEFNCEEHYKAYKHIGKTLYANKSYYCKDFATWTDHIKVAYHSINDNNSKLQLEWALRDCVKREMTYKEYMLGTLVAIILVLPSSFISLALEGLTEDFGRHDALLICLFLMAFILLFTEALTLIGLSGFLKRARFAEEVIRIIETMKSKP